MFILTKIINRKMKEEYKKFVSVIRSKGSHAHNSGVTFYIRPIEPCFNRSRSLIFYGDDKKELEERIIKMVARWYWPMKYYKIDNVIIGSNSENNALQEYWRVCDPSKKGTFITAVELPDYKKES